MNRVSLWFGASYVQRDTLHRVALHRTFVVHCPVGVARGVARVLDSDSNSVGHVGAQAGRAVSAVRRSIEDDDEPDDVEELPPLEEDNDESSKMEEVD